MMRIPCDFCGCEIGTVQVEELVLLVTVALGFISASVTLGPLLLSYHRNLEWLLALPIP